MKSANSCAVATGHFNLLLNGIEAMEAVNDRPRKLRICSKLRAQDAIVVEIWDHGTGLADAEKAFEAFYTTKEKGMGMGLAVCRSNSPPVRSPSRFIEDRLCARWPRPHQQSLSNWPANWGFPKRSTAYMKT
jgi:Histidine kinase-, DNA gyrase B-, and HSP90-like ATPase